MFGSSTSCSVSMPGLSAPSTSTGSARSVSGSSTPSTSTRSAVPVPGLSAPSAFAGSIGSVPSLSALSASTGSAVPVLGSSAPSASVPSTSTPSASAPSTSAPFTSALSASAPSISFGYAFLMPSLSASVAPLFGSSAFSALVVTPTLGRQKLIELNQREKRVTSEELAPAFILLLLSKPPLLFLANRVSKKRSFDKAFNINGRPLANNQFGKDVNLSLGGCQCPPAVKANRPWQQELLNPKTVYMVEVISLATTIFWDLKFLLCRKHILKLIKKLGFKIKNLKAEIVKE